jgi:hypothetical protein
MTPLIQLLHVGGRWQEFLRTCPLHYTSRSFITGGHSTYAFMMQATIVKPTPPGRCSCSEWGSKPRAANNAPSKSAFFHKKGGLIAHSITLISKKLQEIRAITKRWTTSQRWTLLLTRVSLRWLGGKWFSDLPEEAKLLLGGSKKPPPSQEHPA